MALSGLGMSEGLSGLTVSVPPGRGPRAAVVSGSPYVVDVVAVDGQDLRLRRHNTEVSLEILRRRGQVRVSIVYT